MAAHLGRLPARIRHVGAKQMSFYERNARRETPAFKLVNHEVNVRESRVSEEKNVALIESVRLIYSRLIKVAGLYWATPKRMAASHKEISPIRRPTYGSRRWASAVESPGGEDLGVLPVYPRVSLSLYTYTAFL